MDEEEPDPVVVEFTVVDFILNDSAYQDRIERLLLDGKAMSTEYEV